MKVYAKFRGEETDERYETEELDEERLAYIQIEHHGVTLTISETVSAGLVVESTGGEIAVIPTSYSDGFYLRRPAATA